MTGVIAGMIGGMVAVPGQPTSVSGTPNGVTSSTVSWTAPVNNGGLVINGYKVEYAISPYSSYTVFNADTGNANTSISVTGLTNGGSYKFKVTAKNPNGFGTTSTESGVVVTNIVPAAPTISTTTLSTTNTTDTYSWTAPTANGGSAITTYYFNSTVDNGDTILYADIDLLSTAVSKAFDLGYTSAQIKIQVAAVNSLGRGPYSSFSTAAGSWISTGVTIDKTDCPLPTCSACAASVCSCGACSSGCGTQTCTCTAGTRGASTRGTASKTCYKWVRGTQETTAIYNQNSTDGCSAAFSTCTAGTCGDCSAETCTSCSGCGTWTDVTASGCYSEYGGNERCYTLVQEQTAYGAGPEAMYMNIDPHGTAFQGVSCNGVGEYYGYRRYYCSANGGSYKIEPYGCIDTVFAS